MENNFTQDSSAITFPEEIYRAFLCTIQLLSLNTVYLIQEYLTTGYTF